MVEWSKATVCKTDWRNPRGSSNLSIVTNIYTICRPLCINARDRTAGQFAGYIGPEVVGSNPTLATKKLDIAPWFPVFLGASIYKIARDVL